MLCACENAQVCHLQAGQFATGQHTLHRFHDDALGMLALKDLGFCLFFDATGVTCVPVILLVTLVAGHLDFLTVDHDNIVAHIHVRREGRLVLATQAHCDNRRKTAQNNAFSVDNDPFLVDIRRCRGKSSHNSPILVGPKAARHSDRWLIKRCRVWSSAIHLILFSNINAL